MVGPPPIPGEGDGAASGGGGGGGRPLTVTQLGGLIDSALREGLPRKVRVVGEVSNFKERGHWYFDLKDAGAVVSCVMWESAARKVVGAGGGYRPEPGHEVVVTGRGEFWARGGRTQFYAEKIEPVGAGALDLEFRRLCEELKGLGWFDPERKRPLPRMPRKVAVVTSRTGAALQDVLDTMRRRCPAVGVALGDVRVQGEGAAAEVARALGWLSRRGAALGIDAVLLTRGGGSKEDLWTFNERIVAEAIVRCSLPVVAAIGHETDTTIAELVADERCATPTQAAMRLTPDTAAMLEQVDHLAARLRMGVLRQLRHERERLRSAARHPFLADPRARVREGERAVDAMRRRLVAAVRERVGGSARRLERLSGRLERHRPATVHARREAQVAALSERLAGALRTRLERLAMEVDSAERALELVGPVSVLRRGFSCTLRADGTVVRSVSEVQTGEALRTRVLDGTFLSVVVEGQAAADQLAREGAAAAERTTQKRATKGRGGKGGKKMIVAEPGLFDGE